MHAERYPRSGVFCCDGLVVGELATRQGVQVDELRKPIFLLAVLMAVLALALELGSQALTAGPVGAGTDELRERLAQDIPGADAGQLSDAQPPPAALSSRCP